MTNSPTPQIPDPELSVSTTSSDRRRRRIAAPTTAVLLSTIAFGALPLAGLGLAPADASASPAPIVAQFGSPGSDAGSLIGDRTAPTDTNRLDAPAKWDAPGIKEGIALIGWVKAAVIVLGVLGMMGGVVVGKVLKETGNHHASGARATALGIGAAMVIAGAAPTIVPQLVG